MGAATRIGWLVAVGQLCACAGNVPIADIQTRKAVEHFSPRRLLVLQSTSDVLAEPFSTNLQTTLRSHLARCGVTTDFVVRQVALVQPLAQLKMGASPGEDIVNPKSGQHDGVLVVKESSSVKNSASALTVVTYRLFLSRTEDGNEVWQATAELFPFRAHWGYASSDMGSDFAKGIVERMKAEKFLTDCSR